MEVLLSYRQHPRALSDARLVTIEGGVALPLPSLFDPVRVLVPVSSHVGFLEAQAILRAPFKP